MGNDLDKLHGHNQTYSNLEFTLKNEPIFPNTDKIFMLNRIYDIEKKKNIIKLLDKYNFKYIDLPFDIEEFNKIKYDSRINEYINVNKLKLKNSKIIFNKLYNHNLYLINNNGARNFCLNYGKKKGYLWTFVLDSNSYFTQKLFYKIINNVKTDTSYIIIPQIRLSDNKLTNESVLSNNFNENAFQIQEPQIAFKYDSKLEFNSKIPYGSSPKAELLRVLQIPGKWNKWDDNKNIYNIKDRKKVKVKFQVLSKIIRLNPQNKDNQSKNNYKLRIIGLNNLINKILKENNNKQLIESFSNKENNEPMKKILLILIILLFILILFKSY